MKTYYLIHVSHTNNAKNKLQQAFQDYILESERILQPDSTVIQEQIKKKVLELNQQYSRCKPLRIWFDNFDRKTKKTIGIFSSTGIHCSIIQTTFPLIDLDYSITRLMADCISKNLHCSFTHQRANDYSIEIYNGYKENYRQHFHADGHTDPVEAVKEAFEFLATYTS